jgi:hypothetical protein
MVLLLREISQGSALAEAGVVDERIDATVTLDGLFDIVSCS